MRVFNYPLAVLHAYILLQKNFQNNFYSAENCAENTLFHIWIHWAELYPISNEWAEPYLNTLSWTPSLYIEPNPLSIHWAEPYLNTLQSAASQIRILRHSANQNRVLRHPRSLGYIEVPSRLSARVGSL